MRQSLLHCVGDISRRCTGVRGDHQPVDFVWVIGEDGQRLPAGMIVTCAVQQSPPRQFLDFDTVLEGVLHP